MGEQGADRPAGEGPGPEGPPAGAGRRPSGRTPPPGRARWAPDRDLLAAVATGLVLVGLVAGALAAGPPAFTALVLALVLATLTEVARVLTSLDRTVSLPALLLGGAVIVIGAHVAGGAGQAVGVAALFLAVAAHLLAAPPWGRVVKTAATTLLLGLWVGFLASYAVLLGTREVDAVAAVLTVVGAAVVADIGAYAVGSLAGRHRIAPRISPGKTWEGLLGGLVAAGGLPVVVLPLLDGGVALVPAAGLGVAVGLAAFLGDLLESLVKRDLGVKDLGGLLPGHGGLLDRVDGILLALPVGHYALALLGG